MDGTQDESLLETDYSVEASILDQDENVIAQNDMQLSPAFSLGSFTFLDQFSFSHERGRCCQIESTGNITRWHMYTRSPSIVEHMTPVSEIDSPLPNP